MAPTNLIINGDFENGGTGWSGTDVEFNPESAFLGNGSSNTVSEIDGNAGQTTVLEQTFTVDDPQTGTLTFDTALRTASLGDAGQDGFRVDILDENGVVISSMTVLPTEDSFSTISMDVDFPSAGDYTLRFTELGLDDSRGAIIDNVSLIVCFCDGTMIRTDQGEQPVEILETGDLVLTETGYKSIKWIGRRRLDAKDLAAEPRLFPVRIRKGALGGGLPNADLRVSRQHRMQASSNIARRMFGAREVLVSAIRLTELPNIEIDTETTGVTYYHLLFDDHEIVYANGAPSESMLLSETALAAISPDARRELHLLFPGLTTVSSDASVQVIPNRKRQKRFVERLNLNSRPVIEQKSA